MACLKHAQGSGCVPSSALRCCRNKTENIQLDIKTRAPQYISGARLYMFCRKWRREQHFKYTNSLCGHYGWLIISRSAAAKARTSFSLLYIENDTRTAPNPVRAQRLISGAQWKPLRTHIPRFASASAMSDEGAATLKTTAGTGPALFLAVGQIQLDFGHLAEQLAKFGFQFQLVLGDFAGPIRRTSRVPASSAAIAGTQSVPASNRSGKGGISMLSESTPLPPSIIGANGM